jgi:regulator of sigma E protease
MTTRPILFGDEKLRSIGVVPYEELWVEKLAPDSPAALAGIKKGDRITALGGKKLYDYYDYADQIEKIGTESTTLSYSRDGKEYSVQLTPELVKIDKEGETAPEIGLTFEMQTEIIHQDPVSQIVDAAVLTWRTLTTLVNPASDIKITHMSGPPGIAWMIHRLSGDIRQLLFFIVLINVNLAILNLLPLPVLDGGQIVIATLNKLRGKPLPAKLIAGIQNAFALLLLGLMAYIMCFADVPRVGREWKEENALKKAQSDQIEPVFSPLTAPEKPAQ